MTPVLLVSLIVLGAATLALWGEVRLADRGPSGGRARFVHFAAGMLIVGLLPEVMRLLFAHDDSPTTRMVALFGLFLPGMTYAFLSAIWLLKMLQETMHAR